jgi:hypothetical protein
MPSSLLQPVIVLEFQTTDAYSSLDLTKAKHSISRLSMVAKENVNVRINPSNSMMIIIMMMIMIVNSYMILWKITIRTTGKDQ